MEIISELPKVLSSFSPFRQHLCRGVLGAVMPFLMPYFIALQFMFLGLLSGVIQAVVFLLLTIIFISTASEQADNGVYAIV